MDDAPPLFLDIDGTVTRAAGGLDPRVVEPLRGWDAPIVFATGKAFPYPVALCHFLALPERVVAENGGIICVDDRVEHTVAADRLDGFAYEAAARGVDFGWGAGDTVNRWRETELAVARDAIDRDELEAIARAFDLEVVDSGYAFHVKDPSASKGAGLSRACELLEIDPAGAVAIGDSENDVSMFELAGRAVAVANADATAAAAADAVAPAAHADGLLAVLRDLEPG